MPTVALHSYITKNLLFRLGLFLYIICLLNVGNIKAQQFNFKAYSLEEGLSQSEINTIFQDSRGYIWVGTSGGGICKFEGTEFTTFDSENGLAGQIITDIAEDKQGNLWIGSTWGGISKFDGKHFKVYDHTKGLPENYSSSVLVTKKEGKIYVGTGSGLCVLDGERFKLIPTEEGIKLTITKLIEDNYGNLWLSTTYGLKLLQNNKIISPTNALKEPIRSVAIDKNNMLIMVLQNNTVIKQQINSKGVLEKHENITSQLPKLIEDRFYGVYIDNYDRVWITTYESGLIELNKDKQFQYTKEHGLQSNRIISVLQDRTGCMWLGSRGSGLIKFKDRSFTYYDNLPGLNDGEIFSILPDSSNNIWIGTHFNGIYRFDGKKTYSYSNHPLLKKFNVRTICLLRNKTILFGGPKGLRMYNGRDITMVPGISDEPRLKSSVIFEDSKGSVWIGTFGQGLYLYQNKKIRKIANPQDGHLFNIYSIVEINNTIWVGTGEGIYLANEDGEFRKISENINLCNLFIGSMVKDKFGRLWIGTDKCLTLYDGKKFQSFGVKDGLVSSTIYSIICDLEGNLWVGSNKGLDKVEFDKDGSIMQISNYGFNEGFKGIECNSRSACVDQKGNLWFGTIKGAIKYDAKQELIATEKRQPIFIESFQVNFQEYADTSGDYLNYWFRLPKNPKVEYHAERIAFTYNTLNPAMPNKTTFSYKLEGLDEDWSPWISNNSVAYSSLKSGNFKFKVRAKVNNVVLPDEAVFPFTVKTPFYLTIWFLLGSIIVLSFIVYLASKFRKNRAQENLEKLEQIISERTFEIQKQSEEKEILLKEIHHRVKNNLQVINSLINIQSSYIEDEKALSIFEECKNRIRTIALIHEKLYKSQDFKKINFNDYLILLIQDLVKTYNVDTEIELKTDLQIEYFNLNTIVPLGLLLNEVISNSLKYAFRETDKGEISISLKEKSMNQFELLIGDNGCGYEGEPNKPSKSTLGLELIKILTEQLDGNITKLNQKGTVYLLEFKLQKN